MIFPPTRHTRLPKAAFCAHRSAFFNHFTTPFLALLSGRERGNGDRPSGRGHAPNFFYLSGITQKKSLLLLQGDQMKGSAFLFIEKPDSKRAQWEGISLTRDMAREISGIESVFFLEDFEKIFAQSMKKSPTLHVLQKSQVESKEKESLALDGWCKKKYPNHGYLPLAPIMALLRMIKSPWEIEMLKKAGAITAQAFAHLPKHIAAGKREYEIEAALAHDFIAQGSHGFAYSPIVAGGDNANVLHYNANGSVLKKGEVLLVDAGAEYGGYCSDMTRVFPIGGKFNGRQRAIYTALLGVMQAAKSLLVVGKKLAHYEKEVAKVMEKALIQLGLLSENSSQSPDHLPTLRTFFMHKTTHHLGLEVHDGADYSAPIAPGMVLTVEPGIYIKEEGTGMRLENTFLVEKEGLFDLNLGLPLPFDLLEKSFKKRKK